MDDALTEAQLNALTGELDLGLDTGICVACLSFVSFALDEGNPRKIAGELRRMTPDLWGEGLADEALSAVRRARDLGVPGSATALADLESNGGRSVVARAIVRRLAEELSRRTRAESAIESIARSRLGLSPPELN